MTVRYAIALELSQRIPDQRNDEILASLESQVLERTKENRQLSLVAKHAINGVLIADKNRRIIWANKSLCDITGYELDVIREGSTVENDDDVELTEFSDEIDAWIIEEFAKIGLDTARSILGQNVNDLVRRTDLEEETILDVMRILKEEFES